MTDDVNCGYNRIVCCFGFYSVIFMRSMFLRSAPRLRLDGLTLLLVCVGVLAAGIVLLRQHTHGPYFSIDAVHYLAIARNLVAGDGYVSFDGGRPAHWPPGFASLMAIASLSIFDPRDVVGPLNAVALGLTVLIAGLWLRGRIESRFLIVWGCLALVFSIPMVWIATYALSESVFILSLALALICANRFLQTGSKQSLILAGMFGCMVCLIRYSGVPVVLAVAVLMMFSRNFTGLDKLRRIVIYLGISLLPLCLWLVRNMVETGTFTGPRIQPDIRLLEDTYLVLKVLTVWLFQVQLQSHNPIYSEPVLPFESVMLWFSLACACVLIVVLASVAVQIFFQWRSGEVKPDRRVFALVAGAIAMAYMGFLVLQPAVMSTVTMVAEFLFPSYARDDDGTLVHTPISTRYVAPLYFLIVVVAVYSLDRLLCIVREREWLLSLGRLPLVRSVARGRLMRIRVLSPILMIALCVWICYGGYVSALDTREAIVGEGHGRATKSWQASPILEHVRNRMKDDVIFTNSPYYVYPNGGGHRFVGYLAENLVSFGKGQSAQASSDSDDNDVYIVWTYFFDEDNRYQYGGADLRLRVPGLEPAAEFPDGLVFRVNHSYDPSDAYNAFVASYDSVSAEQFLLRSVFDVHVGDTELHYAKTPCEKSDIELPFFMHVHPVDASDLPDSRRDIGFENLDFIFGRWGLHFDGKCFASAPLPDYLISSISTGQFIPGERELWRVRYNAATTDALSIFEELNINDAEPVVRSVFNVYIEKGRLIYMKPQCTNEDRDTRFFVHLHPTDMSDLPEQRKEYGFDNLDFNLWERGWDSDEDCFAVVELPEYEIARISTGQFTPDGRVWSEEIHPEKEQLSNNNATPASFPSPLKTDD